MYMILRVRSITSSNEWCDGVSFDAETKTDMRGLALVIGEEYCAFRGYRNYNRMQVIIIYVFHEIGKEHPCLCS